jgi:hypothetical protein
MPTIDESLSIAGYSSHAISTTHGRDMDKHSPLPTTNTLSELSQIFVAAHSQISEGSTVGNTRDDMNVDYHDVLQKDASTDNNTTDK